MEEQLTSFNPRLPQILVTSAYVKEPFAPRSVVLALGDGEGALVGLSLNFDRAESRAYAVEVETALPQGETKLDLHYLKRQMGGSVLTYQDYFLYFSLTRTLSDFSRRLCDRAAVVTLNQMGMALSDGTAQAADFRVFSGCVLWDAKQTRQEVAKGTIKVLPFSASLVFSGDSQETLWDRAMQQVEKGVDPARHIKCQMCGLGYGQGC